MKPPTAPPSNRRRPTPSAAGSTHGGGRERRDVAHFFFALGCGSTLKSYRPGAGFSTTSAVNLEVSGLTYRSWISQSVKYGLFGSSCSAAEMATLYQPGGAPSRAPVMTL